MRNKPMCLKSINPSLANHISLITDKQPKPCPLLPLSKKFGAHNNKSLCPSLPPKICHILHSPLYSFKLSVASNFLGVIPGAVVSLSYYIRPKGLGMMSDWQRHFSPEF